MRMVVVWFWRNFCCGPNAVKRQMVKNNHRNSSDCELNSLLWLQSRMISCFPALEVRGCLSAVQPQGQSEVVVSCNRVKSGMWVCVHVFLFWTGVFSAQLYISRPHPKQISQCEVFLPAGTNRHLTDVGGGGFTSSLCHDPPHWPRRILAPNYSDSAVLLIWSAEFKAHRNTQEPLICTLFETVITFEIKCQKKSNHRSSCWARDVVCDGDVSYLSGCEEQKVRDRKRNNWWQIVDHEKMICVMSQHGAFWAILQQLQRQRVMVQASQTVCVCLRTACTVLCAINAAPSVLIVLISPKQTLFGFDECL